MTAQQDYFSGLDVSRETLDRLEIYYELLRKWNPKINLVAPSTLAVARRRHFLDSFQLLSKAPTDWRRWVDLGSGGGFPGLVVAIAVAETHASGKVTLIEADARKATFLRAVARETDIPVSVVCERIEHASPSNADIVSARALAPLPKLLEYVSRHCRADGTALLLKGAKADSEVSEARKYWHFVLRESSSLTDSTATILEIRELRGV